MRVVRGLAFAGGLLKAVTLIGGLKAFEEETRGLKELRAVAGSSSGAILAALLATGWTADEMADQLIDKTRVVGDLVRHNPFSLSKLSLLWKLVRGRGLDDGALLYDTLGRMLARHCDDNADVTFLEAEKRFGRGLVITASCYSSCEDSLVLFSTRLNPQMPIRTALRASAAYPGLMLPAEIAGKVYYDGGLTCNYPLLYLQEQYPELRDDCYGLTFDFSRQNELAYEWLKDEWPGITDIAINVVSLLYYRIAHLEAKQTYRYHERTVRIPAEEDNGSGEPPQPRKLLHISANAPEMRQMFVHGLMFTTEWLQQSEA